MRIERQRTTILNFLLPDVQGTKQWRWKLEMQ